MTRFSAILLAALAAASAFSAETPRRVSFNESWRFTKGDPPQAQSASFDDSAWRSLNLPHDWAIEGPFAREHGSRTGGLPIHGVAWYRKHFKLPAGATGKRVAIEFDGAMSNSRVWLNGAELGGRPYGYIGFSFDLTPHLKTGGENVLAVRLAPEDLASRWYPGAGIYRNVWLDITAPVHVARWGTYITTPEVSDARAVVAMRTEIRNAGDTPAEVTLETALFDPSGAAAAKPASLVVKIPAGSVAAVDQSLYVPRPQRWDVDSPRLHRAVSTVKSGAQSLDRYTTPFGIRSIAFDAKKGFLLNGRVLKLKGVCLHHDLGALGAAVSYRATERQLEIMKTAGVNAIRTSHNPPSPEQLELCDRMGLLVMDESYDVWRIPKVPNGYNKYFDEWGETDLRDMVRRDRNHPSVVLWSIGNEIGEQGRPEGAEVGRRLTNLVHREDPTRPVTAGFNIWPGAITNGLAAVVDVPGFNYKPMHYEQVLREHPEWVIVGAESSSCVSSRGVYHLPIEKYDKHPSLQLTSYDVIAPPWAYAPDVEFDAQDRFPQVLGEFVWTGFDYLGEPTPFGGRDHETRGGWSGDWPSRSSYFGFVDLAGFPKDRFYLYQSLWTDKPMVHILPHWNWAGREGQAIPVFAYSNCEEVELFLNGRSLGRKTRGAEPVEIPVGPNVSATRKFQTRYRLRWDVPYQPGVLKAVGLRGGKPASAKEIRTAGAPARIRVEADRARIKADGEDLSFLTVRIEDRSGNLCPSADNLVRFQVEGSGVIAAVDNGNAASVESFQADHRKAFSGMCLLVVRSKKSPGAIRVTASSDGLAGAGAVLTAAR